MNTNSYKGALHIHSALSYDGSVPLRDIASRAREDGLSFLLMTEHARDVKSKAAFDELVALCRKNSTATLLVLPGVEYDYHPHCHLLLLGISEPVQGKDIMSIVQSTCQHGGLAVVSHYDFRESGTDHAVLDVVDGIEIWNKKYDGALGFLPVKGRKFNRLRMVHQDLKMYCGLDFHSWCDWAKLHVSVRLQSLEREQLVSALRKGEFTISTGRFTLEAKRYALPLCAELDMWAVAGLSYLLNRVKAMGKAVVDTIHLPVSNDLRERMRRFP